MSAMAGLLFAAQFDDGSRVSVFADRVAIGGRVYRPIDFEPSFHDRGAGHSHVYVGVEGEIRVLSWARGFGCDVAACRVGTDHAGPGAREFRLVRTGLGGGWFDLVGVEMGG